MRKGLSPIVAAVILIAATMSIAGILTFWTSGFVSKKLSESSNTTGETACLGAEFKLHPSSSYNKVSGVLSLRLDNIRSVDLKLMNLYVFDSSNKMTTHSLNSTLLRGNEIKPLDSNVGSNLVSGEIKTNCPEVSLQFTYSEGALR